MIACEFLENDGIFAVPLVRRGAAITGVFVKGLGPDLEGCSLFAVMLNHPQDFRGHILCFVPVHFIPVLKCIDLRAGYLNVQLDVVTNTGVSEIGRAHEGGRADDGFLRVSDVGLRVEFVFAIHATLDLAGLKGFDDGRHPFEKVVFPLFRFDAVIQCFGNLLEALVECPFCPERHFVAHQNSNLRNGLPCFLKSKQTTELKIPSRYVDTF